MRRRSGLIGVIVLALALAAAGAARWWPVATSPSCPVGVTTSAGGVELVEADELVPAGSVGAARSATVDAVRGLAPALGALERGRFYDAEPVPALLPLGSDLGLANADGLRSVDLATGALRWRASYDVAPRTGGLVGEDLVTLVAGGRPALVTLEPQDGTLTACMPVPTADAPAGEALALTDQAGTDVVVAVAPGSGADVSVSRLSPLASAGDAVAWTRTERAGTAAGTLTVAGDMVVLGRHPADPVRLAEVAGRGTGTELQARALADGTPGWTWPRGRDAGDAAAVLGWDEATGTLPTLVASRDGGEPAFAVTGLSAGGQRRWSVPLGDGLWSGNLVGGATASVLLQGPAPGGGTVLRALDPMDGGERWRLRSREVPSLGDDARVGFGAATTLPDRLLLPAPNGLLLVDPRTGRIERLDSPVPVEQVLPLGERVVVRTARALFVLAGPGTR